MANDVGRLVRGGKGEAYAHEYDGFLGFFRSLGHATEAQVCLNVPRSWAPFVAYLGHTVKSVQAVKEWGEAEGPGLDWLAAYRAAADPRRVVEMASTARPELVHALYLADTEWPCPLRARGPLQPAFPVTCNGSFFRREVLGYTRRLQSYTPPPGVQRAVIVPCAAVKPYPSPLHKAVQQRLPDRSWHVIVATGVLGLLPEELWPVAPEYDSGLPYLDRVTQTARWYFSRHHYGRVVVFSDFYAYALRQGLRDVPRLPVSYVLGDHYRDTYENLLLPEHLNRLEMEMRS